MVRLSLISFVCVGHSHHLSESEARLMMGYSAKLYSHIQTRTLCREGWAAEPTLLTEVRIRLTEETGIGRKAGSDCFHFWSSGIDSFLPNHSEYI